ncbi:hypothetical protein [Streptomyces sp. NPDC047000]|uniref:hypothetical protein n=1 Tax=Streptomyces sp. NPDC047000 TaxID=3155474 RepID=UPI00340F60CB
MLLHRQRRPAEPGPYWKQRTWRLSAGFLAVVLLAGGFTALTSGHGTGDDRTGTAVPDGPLSGATALQNGRPPGCRTDDSAGGARPRSAPKDIRWQTLGVARVPVSASAGPTRTTGPLLWCFAHTPIGAVLAATVIPSQMSGSGWRAVTRQQVVAGQGRDMFSVQRGTVADMDGPEQTGDTSVATYAGFSVTSYTGAAANVRLLLRTGQGYAATAVLVRWSGGDWKVVPDDDGSLHSRVTAVQGDTGGFVLWGV